MATTELEELVEFVSAANIEVRKMAVSIVQGLTGSEEGLRKLGYVAGDLIPSLLRRLYDEAAIAELAASTLVNLSQNPRLAGRMVKLGAIDKAMELIAQAEFPRRGHLVLLLTNLTQSEDGAAQLLQIDQPKLEGLHLCRLVELFVSTSSSPSSSAENGRGAADVDAWDHATWVLVNVTRLEKGRRLVLERRESLLKPLLQRIWPPPSSSPSLPSSLFSSSCSFSVRRQGIARVIRNCCFEVERQLDAILDLWEWLLPVLLVPLAGCKGYSEEEVSKMPAAVGAALKLAQVKEKDVEVQVAAAESLLLIGTQQGGRKALWAANVPVILQRGYEEEEDPQVLEALEKLGTLFVAGNGDGGGEEEDRGEEEGGCIPPFPSSPH
ncbi:hypothetical protein CBR_g41270 [Chara braunii]|uniref:Protein HGH1 homolog n=1 Tax=Chara braunii TaxID=69332 RepID=A0A388LVC1_CHABU|nr:hypothetical protein CBR_g41270 [Chara braunii]|eukprot:GBG86276.1 hypothetical protein CBR_g41270 [Chara braunii]